MKLHCYDMSMVIKRQERDPTGILVKGKNLQVEFEFQEAERIMLMINEVQRRETKIPNSGDGSLPGHPNLH